MQWFKGFCSSLSLQILHKPCLLIDFFSIELIFNITDKEFKSETEISNNIF